MMTCCAQNADCFMKRLVHRTSIRHLPMRRLEYNRAVPPPTDPTVFDRFAQITSIPRDLSISTGVSASGRSYGLIRKPLPRPVFAICLTSGPRRRPPVVLGDGRGCLARRVPPAAGGLACNLASLSLAFFRFFDPFLPDGRFGGHPPAGAVWLAWPREAEHRPVGANGRLGASDFASDRGTRVGWNDRLQLRLRRHEPFTAMVDTATFLILPATANGSRSVSGSSARQLSRSSVAWLIRCVGQASHEE